jgi:mannose-6-phosphate isomerase
MDLPAEVPIGEAWILSDRDDFPSVVANGPLKGRRIGELIQHSAKDYLGDLAQRYTRYPLLLKFLDAKEMLSVQVHPSDKDKAYLPPGELGKTEAWVVLEVEPHGTIFAGLQPGTTPQDLRHLNGETADKVLASFHPKVGDGVFLQSGTVHALGGGVVVFEVQQNSDVTFRLFDWDRVDAKTGKTRELHIEDGIAVTDFDMGPVGPVSPVVESLITERVFDCKFFTLWRHTASAPFPVGVQGTPRVVVCVEGSGSLEFAGESYAVKQGQVYFLPAALGKCQCVTTEKVVLLEVGVGL